MTIDWNKELLDQMDLAWNHQFKPRMEGLTDEEYLWEPVPGCWNVRQSESGSWSIDWERPEPTPPPFTTIAWRLMHIAVSIFGIRASNHFGDGSYSFDTATISGSASEAMALVTGQYTKWHEGVAALGTDGPFRPCGPAEGPYAAAPLATLVLHINREFLHHAAEVMLLRDLYRDMH